jgi:uncharacterized protein YutD
MHFTKGDKKYDYIWGDWKWHGFYSIFLEFYIHIKENKI